MLTAIVRPLSIGSPPPALGPQSSAWHENDGPAPAVRKPSGMITVCRSMTLCGVRHAAQLAGIIGLVMVLLRRMLE
jgi:hypothetical protein